MILSSVLFARAVAAEHADLGPGIEREPNVLEHLALAELLREIAIW